MKRSSESTGTPACLATRANRSAALLIAAAIHFLQRVLHGNRDRPATRPAQLTPVGKVSANFAGGLSKGVKQQCAVALAFGSFDYSLNLAEAIGLMCTGNCADLFYES